MKERYPLRRSRVLGDGWYSWIGSGFLPLTDVLMRWPRPLRAAVLRHGPLRGLALAAASGRCGAVAVIRHDPGWRTLLLLRALLGRRRKLVVLQFIDHGPRTRGLGRLLDTAWRAVERWAIRRAMAVGHVLSDAELVEYPGRFGVTPRRFRLIRYPWRAAPRGAAPPSGRTGPVVAAGRAHCDWETLLAAAAGRGWDLTIVCEAREREAIAARSARTQAGARILSDLPNDAAKALLGDAGVAVIALHDGVASRGHVRLCDATDAGAAVVASRVRSLNGYVEDGRSALLVPPNDPRALREAVERLLRDRALRDRLAATAFERAAQWTGADYLRAIEELAAGVAAG